MTYSTPKLMVGIGASAGGIEACKALFEAVPADTGLAFLVVLHLDPKRTSHLAEILQTTTKHLTVAEAKGAARVEPNHVYVIAPNSRLGLADGHIQVEPLKASEARSRLIDDLFTSIAQSAGSRAVGVVLSGAGHDGTEGLRRIREVDGLTLAQDPATAASASMPQSAIAAGVIDVVLAVDAIPRTLIDFRQNGTRPQSEAMTADGDGNDPYQTQAKGFTRVLQQLGAVADVNFEDYKTGTLERRARRRMLLKGVEDWVEYAELLAADHEERDALYYDVLIGVTEFFRDPPMWDQLGDELMPLLEERAAAGLRGWVPGCGTGEEAYSLAILLNERLPAERNKVQIYATDLNERALVIARRGLYAKDAIEHLVDARRERYFHPSDGQLQIDRSIRDPNYLST